MKRTMKVLRVELFASILASLLLVALFEADALPCGVLCGGGNAEFILACIMELLTICLVPLSLWLFKVGRIGRDLRSRRGAALLRWGTIRMMMLCLPMVSNTLLYYLFMNVAFGYMAIIGLISLAFIYPGRARCEAETKPVE